MTINVKETELNIKKYSEQIWLAGLGAFSKAEEEGQRFFEQLVKIGEELEGKTSEVVVEVRDNLEGKISGVATGARAHLGSVVDRTTNMISSATKSGEPVVNMIKKLHARVDTLLQEIESLKKDKA
jgi:poly(hydroxyalkanoate) granule-associated protein